MKIIASMLIVLIWAGTAVAATKKEITLAGIRFVHAWSDSKPAITTQEYVDTGQTLQDWQHLLAYRNYPTSTRLATVVNAYLAQIAPTQEPAVYRRSDSDLMLVFIMEPPDGEYMEYNIHRFVVEAGNVRSYQLAVRNWKRDLSSLRLEVEGNQKKWMEAVSNLKSSTFAGK